MVQKNQHVQMCIQLLAHDDAAILTSSQDVFETVISATVAYQHIPDMAKSLLVDAMCSNLSVLNATLMSVSAADDAETRQTNRSALMCYVTFLHHILQEGQKINSAAPADATAAAAELVAGKRGAKAKAAKAAKAAALTEYDWPMLRAKTMRALASATVVDLQSLFSPAPVDDALLTMLGKCAILLPFLAHESYTLRSAIVGVMGSIVAGAFSANDEASVEDGPGGPMARLRSKQHVLDLLCERVHDKNAYTRSKTLQVWASLCADKLIPIGHWNHVAKLAVGRLNDKSSLVRKAAMQLLGTLMQFNPFAPELPSAAFATTLQDCGAADALVNTNADNVLKKTENADVEKGWLGCSVVVRFVVTLFYSQYYYVCTVLYWCNYS